MSDVATPRTAFAISPIGKPGTEDHARHLLVLNYLIRKALPEPD